MGYTVLRPGGTKDGEFQAYARLLRQMGKDLGKLPRVAEPSTNRRWLHVWNTYAEAQMFAEEMKERMGNAAWEVQEVPGQASEGPLGPLVVQLGRQATGLTFALHPLSRALIESAFPRAVVLAHAFIDLATWNDFRQTRGDVRDLVDEVLPRLSGLHEADLHELGYEAVDAETSQTLFVVPPAVLAQV